MDTKIKWNAKYKERIQEMKKPVPNPRLMNFSAYLKGGIALDLACGLGGNSVFLAQRNYQVHAFDISDIAINFVKEQAVIEKLKIHPKVCDFTNEINWQNSSFDLIVITYYLERTLFPIVKKMISDHGYFFMETFLQSPQSDNGKVTAQYKLRPQELLDEFRDWKVLFYEENEHEGRQTIFCQK